MNYIPVYYIINKVSRDYDIEEDEAKLIEWVAEAMRFLNISPIIHSKHAILQVKNYKSKLPYDFEYMIQVFKVENYNGKCFCDKTSDNCLYIISEQKVKQLSCEESKNVCNTVIYIKDNIDNIELKNIRLNTDTSFGCIECNDTNNLVYAYNNGNLLFSFKNGFVLINYYGIPTDKNGYPLIPDDISFITAVSKYIVFKNIEKLFFKQKMQAYIYQEAKNEWLRYAKQAKNKLTMPTIDELQNIYENYKSDVNRERWYTKFKTIRRNYIKTHNLWH